MTAAVSITLVAALIGAAATQALNLEAILGAYIAGILIAGLRHMVPGVRSVLETITAAFVAPIFFAFSGLRMDIGLLDTQVVIVWTVALIALAVVAKVVGTVIGGFFGGIRFRESLAKLFRVDLQAKMRDIAADHGEVLVLVAVVEAEPEPEAV